MEVVSFGRVDRQTAVSEDLQDFVEVCEDVTASESVLVMAANHVNPSKSNGENVIFAFESEGENLN